MKPLAATGNADRDSTLKTADFFDVAKFAQARYSASGFRRLADGRYVADGTLELRGVRKPVTLTFAWTGGTQPVLEGKASTFRDAIFTAHAEYSPHGIPDTHNHDDSVVSGGDIAGYTATVTRMTDGAMLASKQIAATDPLAKRM